MSMHTRKVTRTLPMGVFYLLVACTNQGYSILASTGTIIGVEVSQNPATQMPQGKLGYNRAELAFVPTNRNGGPNAAGYHNGARDSANVLMELRYGGIFDMGESSGIYQRLAVGDIAVAQQGAAVMFAKDADGEIDANAEKALQAVKSIPLVQGKVEAKKAHMSTKYNEFKKSGNSAGIEKYDHAAITVDSAWGDYPAFATDPNASDDKVKAVCSLLKAQGEDLTCD